MGIVDIDRRHRESTLAANCFFQLTATALSAEMVGRFVDALIRKYALWPDPSRCSETGAAEPARPSRPGQAPSSARRGAARRGAARRGAEVAAEQSAGTADEWKDLSRP